jgi:hypothetical protein
VRSLRPTSCSTTPSSPRCRSRSRERRKAQEHAPLISLITHATRLVGPCAPKSGMFAKICLRTVIPWTFMHSPHVPTHAPRSVTWRVPSPTASRRRRRRSWSATAHPATARSWTPCQRRPRCAAEGAAPCRLAACRGCQRADTGEGWERGGRAQHLHRPAGKWAGGSKHHFN